MTLFRPILSYRIILINIKILKYMFILDHLLNIDRNRFLYRIFLLNTDNLFSILIETNYMIEICE